MIGTRIAQLGDKLFAIKHRSKDKERWYVELRVDGPIYRAFVAYELIDALNGALEWIKAGCPYDKQGES